MTTREFWLQGVTGTAGLAAVLIPTFAWAGDCRPDPEAALFWIIFGGLVGLLVAVYVMWSCAEINDLRRERDRLSARMPHPMRRI